jgi:carboxynorspermidine decarboxylase
MHLHEELGNLLQRVKWINLGGGYLLDGSEDLTPLYEAVEFLRANYGLQVFIEPGSAFIQSAGYIVSSVLDVYQSGDADIVVLDTTVNHMPEVFEYGYEPDVIGHDNDAAFEYILAGCTCLAGDVFGEYGFDRPLKVGERIIFYNVGAYTLSKAHMFNGVNLPAIYALTEAGDLVLKQRFTYDDFAAKWGANARINH